MWKEEFLRLEEEIKQMRIDFTKKYCEERNIPALSEEDLSSVYAMLCIKAKKKDKE